MATSYASRIEKTETCWLWTGTVASNGYGRVKVKGRLLLAHRVVYESLVGPISEGLQIDHLCRVRNCVNPSHLEPVTARENTLRSTAPSALNAIKTHCPQGHPYDAANTGSSGPGRRRCRECHRTRQAARRAADPQSHRDVVQRSRAKRRAA